MVYDDIFLFYMSLGTNFDDILKNFDLPAFFFSVGELSFCVDNFWEHTIILNKTHPSHT